MTRNILFEKLTGIVERIKNKQSYHYVCYAGSTVVKIDIFGDIPVLDCPHKGDDDWGKLDLGHCPCKNCNGKLNGFLDCNAPQRWENRGIEKLFEAIKQELPDIIE